MNPIFIILILLFYITCLWKIFEKAGEKGWLILIPIVNIFYFFKISDKSPNWFFVLPLIIIAKLWNNDVNGGADHLTINSLISIASLIFIFSIARSFTRKFGDNSFWHPLAFIFVNFLYLPLLAFDKEAIYNSIDRGVDDKFSNNSLKHKAPKEILKWHFITNSLFLLLCFIIYTEGAPRYYYAVSIIVWGGVSLILNTSNWNVGKDEFSKNLSKDKLDTSSQHIINEKINEQFSFNKKDDVINKDEKRFIENELKEPPSKKYESIVDEITSLNDLKEKGILSEEEFNEQKKKLLKQ